MPKQRLANHKRLRELHLPNCDCRARVGSQPSMHIFLEGGAGHKSSKMHSECLSAGLHRNGSLTMLDLSMNRLTATSALVLEAGP